MPSTSIKPTEKAPVNGKRRRPTFRPASQRKTSLAKDASSSVTHAATPAASEENVPPPDASLPDDTLDALQEPQEEEDITVEKYALTVSMAATAKRSTKKRKATTGVAIGSSRPEDKEDYETAQGNETVVLAEPQVPDAEPGQVTLKTFCSRYRTKETRTATQNAAKAPAQQPQNALVEQSATTSAGPVVQVVNGEIVLQESSVVVPGARRSVQEVEAEYEQVVEEETQHSAVIGASYNSFVSRRAPQHWGVAETKKFYNSLRMVGTDFATMAALFDDRTRKQLKRKYQIENTKNSHLIELALSPQARIPLGM